MKIKILSVILYPIFLYTLQVTTENAKSKEPQNIKKEKMEQSLPKLQVPPKSDNEPEFSNPCRRVHFLLLNSLCGPSNSGGHRLHFEDRDEVGRLVGPISLSLLAWWRKANEKSEGRAEPTEGRRGESDYIWHSRNFRQFLTFWRSTEVFERWSRRLPTSFSSSIHYTTTILWLCPPPSGEWVRNVRR